ncbi:MAG: N-acetyl sugar amidotransferase [Alphaproteobacteria bacterium]|nr:N-acetyl sugar amidotransferase [Alphaproteobacteria bacterium]
MTRRPNLTLDRQIAAMPTEVAYCRRCVVSNQRPRIVFDEEGVCSACRYADEKDHGIDWDARDRQLRALCDAHRRGDGTFDCLVPCSGGKDGSMVAHRLKHQYGMTPLTVTWSPFRHTEIGWANLQRFIASGFSNVMGTPNGNLHRKLARIAFESVGDAFQPFSYGQMAFVFHMAVNFGIRLVFFGENAEVEYGGTLRNKDKPGQPLEDWADLYYKGVTVDDMVRWGMERGLISPDDFTPADLGLYKPPPAPVLREKGIEMHWMSFYRKWVPQENYYYAVENTGFQANPGRSEGTYSRYASLDDRFDGLHYFMAFVKFGIGRATSDAGHEVRDGHITRQEAVRLVHRFDGEFPARYFQEFLEYLDISEQKFWEITDRYRAPHLWRRDDGEWRLLHRVSDLEPDTEEGGHG